MISLNNGSGNKEHQPEPDEPYKPGMPAPAADIEFWRDVFRALLPEDETEA